MAASQLFAQPGTAASVTAIGGVGVVGGSLLSTADNAFRAMVADLVNNIVTRGSDIASATTLDIDGATTPSVTHNITGTTATTAITLTSGQWRIVRAVGAWPLTAGASLIINGSTTVSYTCTAEDEFLVKGFAAGVVRMWKIGGPGAVSTNGIAFPATQVPSSNANTLDDYEEGTWTPAAAFGGAATGITYGLQEGSYTKIGRLVYIRGRVTLTSKGSSTGAMTITGLPFTIARIASGEVGAAVNFSGLGGGALFILGQASGTTLNVELGSALGTVNLTDAEAGNSADLIFSITYEV